MDNSICLGTSVRSVFFFDGDFNSGLYVVGIIRTPTGFSGEVENGAWTLQVDGNVALCRERPEVLRTFTSITEIPIPRHRDVSWDYNEGIEWARRQALLSQK